MSLSICVLASGSSGNCSLISSEKTRILIDAGLSGKEIGRRLEMVRMTLSQISAVCVTHEHDDHTAALRILHCRHGLPLYANAGTIEAVDQNGKLQNVNWSVFTTGSPFEVGDLRMEPFSVPHDSYDPVGFIISCNGSRVGVVTDMGMATSLIRERLKACQVIVLESNHDEKMLKDCDRPWVLKQRIAGRQGHLSNKQASELICEVAGPSLKAVFLAHLSSECNTPEIARREMEDALRKIGRSDVAVKLTYSDRVSETETAGEKTN